MFESLEKLREGSAKALQQKKSVTIYDNDLSKLWPCAPTERQRQMAAIRQFARDNGWDVTIRDQGLIATFRKASPEALNAR